MAFVGDLILKLLDKLLPAGANYGERSKEALGSYLLRLKSLIDAYEVELNMLDVHLSKALLDPSDVTFLTDRVRRLTALTTEFADTLEELDYLKLFSPELHEVLHSTGASENGMFLWIDDVGLIERARNARVQYLEKTHRLLIREEKDVPTGPLEPMPLSTLEYDLRDVDDRTSLKQFISSVFASLEESDMRLCEFVEKHFEPWELFRVRHKAGS